MQGNINDNEISYLLLVITLEKWYDFCNYIWQYFDFNDFLKFRCLNKYFYVRFSSRLMILKYVFKNRYIRFNNPDDYFKYIEIKIENYDPNSKWTNYKYIDSIIEYLHAPVTFYAKNTTLIQYVSWLKFYDSLFGKVISLNNLANELINNPKLLEYFDSIGHTHFRLFVNIYKVLQLNIELFKFCNKIIITIGMNSFKIYDIELKEKNCCYISFKKRYIKFASPMSYFCNLLDLDELSIFRQYLIDKGGSINIDNYTNTPYIERKILIKYLEDCFSHCSLLNLSVVLNLLLNNITEQFSKNLAYENCIILTLKFLEHFPFDSDVIDIYSFAQYIYRYVNEIFIKEEIKNKIQEYIQYILKQNNNQLVDKIFDIVYQMHNAIYTDNIEKFYNPNLFNE